MLLYLSQSYFAFSNSQLNTENNLLKVLYPTATCPMYVVITDFNLLSMDHELHKIFIVYIQ